jgi:hypothetical protein
MRGVRAAILCLSAALVLPGCMRAGDTILVGERRF